MSEDCRHQESRSIDPWTEQADCPGLCWQGAAGNSWSWQQRPMNGGQWGSPQGSLPIAIAPREGSGMSLPLTPGHGSWVPLGAKEIIKSHIREALGDKARILKGFLLSLIPWFQEGTGQPASC